MHNKCACISCHFDGQTMVFCDDCTRLRMFSPIDVSSVWTQIVFINFHDSQANSKLHSRGPSNVTAFFYCAATLHYLHIVCVCVVFVRKKDENSILINSDAKRVDKLTTLIRIVYFQLCWWWRFLLLLSTYLAGDNYRVVGKYILFCSNWQALRVMGKENWRHTILPVISTVCVSCSLVHCRKKGKLLFRGSVEEISHCFSPLAIYLHTSFVVYFCSVDLISAHIHSITL